MKKITLVFASVLFSCLSLTAQDTVVTSPPLTPNNGQSGISFEVEATQQVKITGLYNIFSSATSANLWMRIGGVGSPPNISTSNGWTQVITNAPITGANSTSKVELPFGSTTITIPANTPVGFYIEGDTRYHTGSTGNPGIFTDGVLSVKTGASYGYGGGPPNPTFHPRQFVGEVIYQGDKPGCPTPSGFKKDAVGCDYVTVSWNSASGSSIIHYGPDGFSGASGTYTGIVTSPHIITGLNPATDYDIYVADTCGTDTSYRSGPVDVTTTGTALSPNFQTTTGVASGVGRSVYFEATSSSTGATFDWDFGDGETGTGKYIFHRYTANGTYTVKLVVSTNCKKDSSSQQVILEEISMEDYVLGSNLKLHPNPVRNSLNVSFTPVKPLVSIKVLDLTGREMLVKNANDLSGHYSTSLDLSNLADGVYMLHITDGENQVTRKVVKR